MKLKAEDIRKMSAIEREKKLEDLRSEQFKIKSSNAMGSTQTDPMKIRMIGRSIARLLTIMRENQEI